MKKFTILVTLVIVVLQCCKKDKATTQTSIPEIVSITPSSAAVGEEVLLAGKNFGNAPEVYFGDAKAQITSKSATEIKVVVPAGTGTVEVYVKNGSDKTKSVSFTYIAGDPQAPVLTSVKPRSAITGDTLVISGKNFNAGTKVLFATTEVQPVFFTATAVTVIIPPGSGTVKLTAQNIINGAVKPSNQIDFTYAQIANNNYGTITLTGVTYKIDTLSYFEIAPGTFYMALNLTESSGGKPLKAFITTVDGTNQYMNFKPVIGRDSVSNNERPSAMAARKSSPGNRYVVGTNSDFFDVTNGTGYQRNANMVDGVLASIGDNKAIKGSEYPGNAIFDAQKRMYIDNLKYSASVSFGSQTMEIDTINYYKYLNTNKLTFFNIYCGKTTGTNNDRTEVAITPVNGSWNYLGETDVKVVNVYPNKGDHAVSNSISYLSGATGAAANFLNQLKKDDVLKLKFSLVPRSGISVTPYNITGGRQIIMRNGTILPDIWNGPEKHPRTGIGYSNSGKKVYFCVIDGRSTASVGVYTSEMAQIMKYFGATDALNFDGGGSTVMYLDKIGIVNTPSDGSERAVVSGMFAVSSAPDDNQIAKIVPKQYIVRLNKGDVFTPVFYGLNKYGQVVNTNVSGVTVQTNGLGTYTDKKFTAGNQSIFGYITAKYQNLSTRIKVFVQ
ncbi:hypothetical protein FW774_12940 [Pedobacter sp. BS3]|uniref:phosphodiester glycosidase family protein n=1 Tax=Pedobacter sp. BS3 TaxID=2567937 RepID=UPI0011EFB7D6|nr:phosphodiester glycosidase family protein [Pedobacter sp. BS3]TZF83192.1 hypothetical protein FW774_12940 [Pedobacter sp. BS3]